MNERTNFNDTTEITAEACAWVAQLSTGELTPADELAIREWIQRSPRHASELKKIANLSMDINVLTEMSESIEEATIEQHCIVKSKVSEKNWKMPFVLISITAFLAIGVFFLNFNSFSVVQPMLISTAVGEFREVELPDGTLVKVNTNTKLEVNYTKQVRKVRLLSGEALFKVKHNSNRPFLVYADEQYVRAVGTAFTVSLLRDKLTVTVVEGKVEFAKLKLSKEKDIDNPAIDLLSSSIKPVFLEVGQHIAVSASIPVGVVETMPENDLKRELSWQHELFDFSDTPLKEVIQELSRYSNVKIEIIDASLLNMKFGGIFRTNDTQPLFEALEATYGVHVIYLNGKHVQLSKIN